MKGYCCSNCFTSKYLKSIINGLPSEKGTCSHCKSENSVLVKTEILKSCFVSFFDSLDYEGFEKSLPFEDFLNKNFPGKIFSENVSVKSIVEDIFGEEQSLCEYYLNQSFCFGYQKVDPSEQLSAQLLLSWEDFTEELTKINRFHLKNELNLDEISKIAHYHHRIISEGEVFYRGRISDKNGFEEKDIINPPPEKATPGRANPEGISYLYLADSTETVVKEVRASYYDLICIGKFTNNEKLNIVNLENVDSYDPMQIADDPDFGLDEFMSILPFTTRLQQELSKPIRRKDNRLDYIPTQYLCEFIKSVEIPSKDGEVLKFDGVQYKSSSNSVGHNLAIFNTDKIKLVERNIFEVNNIDFTFNHWKKL